MVERSPSIGVDDVDIGIALEDCSKNFLFLSLFLFRQYRLMNRSLSHY
jgi:hypothetical protein